MRNDMVAVPTVTIVTATVVAGITTAITTTAATNTMATATATGIATIHITDVDAVMAMAHATVVRQMFHRDLTATAGIIHRHAAITTMTGTARAERFFS